MVQLKVLRTSKDFFNLFIDDNYLDEIVKCSIANTQSKRDGAFAPKFQRILG